MHTTAEVKRQRIIVIRCICRCIHKLGSVWQCESMQRSGPLHPGPVCQQQHISKWFPFNSLQKETFHVAFVTHSAAIIYSNTPKKMTTSMQSNTGLGQVMIGVLHSLVTDLNLAPLGSHWTPPLTEERQLFLFHFCWELLSYYFAEIDMCILITVNHLIFFFFLIT